MGVRGMIRVTSRWLSRCYVSWSNLLWRKCKQDWNSSARHSVCHPLTHTSPLPTHPPGERMKLTLVLSPVTYISPFLSTLKENERLKRETNSCCRHSYRQHAPDLSDLIDQFRRLSLHWMRYIVE